jgi:hypothetical protein
LRANRKFSIKPQGILFVTSDDSGTITVYFTRKSKSFEDNDPIVMVLKRHRHRLAVRSLLQISFST